MTLRKRDGTRTLWRSRFGRSYRPVVSHMTEWMHEWILVDWLRNITKNLSQDRRHPWREWIRTPAGYVSKTSEFERTCSRLQSSYSHISTYNRNTVSSQHSTDMMKQTTVFFFCESPMAGHHTNSPAKYQRLVSTKRFYRRCHCSCLYEVIGCFMSSYRSIVNYELREGRRRYEPDDRAC
jgi:hypothetical protein